MLICKINIFQHGYLHDYYISTSKNLTLNDGQVNCAGICNKTFYSKLTIKCSSLPVTCPAIVKDGGDFINNNNKLDKIITFAVTTEISSSKHCRERNMYINDHINHQHWLQTQPTYVCNSRVFHLKTVFK